MDKILKRKGINVYMIKNKITPWTFLGPAVIVLILVILFPVLNVIKYSFTENIFNNENAKFVGLENYIEVLKDSRFMQMAVFTPVFTIGSVILHLIIGVALAVALNSKINPIALAFFRVLFVLPWVFTAAVVAIVWQLILNTQGVANTIISMITNSPVMLEWLGNPTLAVISLLMINAWRGYPTCMISALAGLQNIPASMYEAAEMDGAGKFRQFFSITLPHLKTVLISVSLLDIINTMNLFPLIWLTTGGGPLGKTETIATLTYRLSFNEFEFGRASALAVISLLVTLIFVVFYAKIQKSAD